MYNDELNEIIEEFMRLPENVRQELDIALGVASGVIAAILIIIIVVVFVIVIVILVGLIVGRWMLFTKAGQAGWKSIIPFYRDYVFIVDVCKCHWVLFLLKLLMFWTPIEIFIDTMINYNLAIKTHQSPTSFIWFTIFRVPLDLVLGFCRKSYEYNADELSSKFGYIGTKQ